jgi:hypothetical protein
MKLWEGWGWRYGMRLKRNRTVGDPSLRTTWPHRYGHAQGDLRGGEHRVGVIKDGRRYWGTNDLTLTPREAKAPYSHRHQIEETFRLLQHECGWGSCSWQKQQAQWAPLHLGLYALVFPPQTAFARGQTIYAFRQSLFLHSIPQNPSTLQKFAQAA